MIGNHIAVIEQRAPFAPMGKQTVPFGIESNLNRTLL